MSKLTKRASYYGRTDPNDRKSLLSKINNIIVSNIYFKNKLKSNQIFVTIEAVL